MFQRNTLCPLCLKIIPLRVTSCPSCNKPLPKLYTDDYVGLPLSIISAVGFGGHGKTVYLAALMHVLDEISFYWPGFYRQALNQESISTVINNKNTLLKKKILPQATARNFPVPSIHRLVNIPLFGAQRLLIYDTAGENFLSDHSLIENAGYVQRSPTVLFFISLPLILREGDSPVDEMQRLLQTYIIGMRNMGVKTTRQNLIVTYTWGDELESWLGDYPDLVDYVSRSELQNGWDMSCYLENLNDVSNRLATFTHQTVRAANFCGMARDHFASVRYCMVSALGRAPVGNNLSMELSPRRVIDPLLWVLSNPRKEGLFS